MKNETSSSAASGSSPRPSRRDLMGVAAGVAALPLLRNVPRAQGVRKEDSFPVLVGSGNGLEGMKAAWPALLAGGDPLDAAIAVVKVQEADPKDSSVGYGGLPNEDGVVQLDAACMYGPTHNSGAVACIENIMHPSEVARLVMERTDHCMLVGRGAYEFARQHGHPHVDMLTDNARKAWLRWKETMSESDDRFPAPAKREGEKTGALLDGEETRVAEAGADLPSRWERHGTIHCSAISTGGDIACTTTTSGLAWKIPGRIGDSPIIGAGLYCDQGVGSAGSTGRGEAAILSTGSAAIIELLRQGKSPKEAGLEVLRRIAEQARRQSSWQPALYDREKGRPSFGINFYILDRHGNWAGVTMTGPEDPKKARRFAVADREGGPRREPLVPAFPA